MVFIHGGGFYSGSGSLETYSPDYLINYDVILVTINYRLHVLGDGIQLESHQLRNLCFYELLSFHIMQDFWTWERKTVLEIVDYEIRTSQ